MSDLTTEKEMNEVDEQVEETCELNLPLWSVIGFDRVVESGLTYEQAASKLAESKRLKISGLCIVTDEVAGRFK